MTLQKPEKQGLSIVLLGDFSPKIFQPAWFAAQELLRKQEAEQASIKIIHSDVVEFSLDWCRIVATQNRFHLSTLQEPYYEPLRDLALGTFKLLMHTPLRMMGINLEKTFRLESEGAWHEYGNRFAPKRPWAKILKKPGLRTLTMEDVRPDQLPGYIRVTVQPSEEIHPALFLFVNDHYQAENPETVLGANELITMLEKCWEPSMTRSNQIMNHLLENGHE